MTTSLKFFKYHGTGNDFIMIDGRNNNYAELNKTTIYNMCHRRFGIGADGLIILKNKEGFDFEMDYYNSDGKRGSMCGNGGRCTVAFAYDLGIIQKETVFFAPDGEHKAVFTSHNDISLKMQNVNKIDNDIDGLFMDTGSPHLVVVKENDEVFDVFTEGRNIRNSERFIKEGTNVNFIIIKDDDIDVSTYERGVENETYSCGTGTVACAISAHKIFGKKSPIKANTKGGILNVIFNHKNDNIYSDIWLQGPALKTFEGDYLL